MVCTPSVFSHPYSCTDLCFIPLLHSLLPFVGGPALGPSGVWSKHGRHGRSVGCVCCFLWLVFCVVLSVTCLCAGSVSAILFHHRLSNCPLLPEHLGASTWSELGHSSFCFCSLHAGLPVPSIPSGGMGLNECVGQGISPIPRGFPDPLMSGGMPNQPYNQLALGIGGIGYGSAMNTDPVSDEGVM